MQTVITVLIFGSLWGLAESTLGYVLHLFPGVLTGSIMFPIGLFFMIGALKRSCDPQVVLYVALVTAMIKTVNIFLPNGAVVNPVLAIISEGAVVYMCLGLAGNYKGCIKQLNFFSLSSLAFVSSLLWRVVFSSSIFYVGKPSKVLSSVAYLLDFVVVKGLMNFAVIVLAYVFFKNLGRKWQLNLTCYPFTLPVACLFSLLAVGTHCFLGVL